MMNRREQSDSSVLCAGRRVFKAGESPARPSSSGVRRVCGEPPGRSRTRRTGRPKFRRNRAGSMAAKEILGVPGCIKVCAGGTVGKEHALPREVSYGPAPDGDGYLVV